MSLLGTWRAHGLDEVLREAWEAGVILCGGSAGALCWFGKALSGFHEGPSARSRRSICCRGAVPFTTTRSGVGASRFLDAVGDGMAAGYGAGDSAALHFVGTELAEVVSSQPQASAAFVSRDEDGVVVERELPVRYLGATVDSCRPRSVSQRDAAYLDNRSRAATIRAGSSRWAAVASRCPSTIRATRSIALCSS